MPDKHTGASKKPAGDFERKAGYPAAPRATSGLPKVPPSWQAPKNPPSATAKPSSSK
ncbi:Uncharacterised protein [Mycobacteroides abscessus subsp. abscessus]|nr:hypothetical protein [Mycobacteroides abscessus]SHQ53326.1 Uncharacterised protein [Mycobacteroides abscessus subsp. abscessus]SHR81529.1 Uncharacterised protein [Mycobacteroides abscessus subsp. abscessus]SIB95296.1 Uncharacterised protein [Mycobacteroides abscessus subsp. abscessus]SLL31012.1 Uncharacterised protein [Mycobacteroides abscessus subsp. abscessus]